MRRNGRGIGERSSKCSSSVGMTNRATAGERISSVWSVPRCWATRFASDASLWPPREADREGLDRSIHQAGPERHDGAGIDATTQECTQRHVGDETNPHGFLHQFEEPLLHSSAATPSFLLKRHVPISAHVEFAVRIVNASAGSFMNTAVDTRGVWNTQERQVAVNASG
jgi:hypothetical protein